MNRDLELGIKTKNGNVAPAILDGAEWSTERNGKAGIFKFKCLFDEKNKFQEGDLITVKYKGNDVFYGYIFTVDNDRDKILSVTAYDQLRYLKSKDTYHYKGKKASDLIKMIAEDFRLNLGEIEDTKFVIPKRLEDNVSLFDIILTALGITLQNTKIMYVMYDNFGKINLKNVESMILNDVIIDETSSENFTFKSTIDKSANKIKLVKDNENTGKRDFYIAQDSEKMNEWGILQHYDTLEEKENGQVKADALLKLYNRKFKTLTIKNVFGDIRVRAGTSIIVKLDLGISKVNNLMLVESAKHIFNNGEHFMALSLRGADIQ